MKNFKKYEDFRKRIKKEFHINKYIILTLEENKTIIYVAFKKFRQCKHMLLNIPLTQIKTLKKAESIDEISERLVKIQNKETNFKISPETEFWGHCSNLQVWYENNYDTRLLHSNLAFPLLKRLTEVGDPLAKKVFRKEIIKRIESKYPPVLNYLLEESYLKYLPDDYVNELLNNIEFFNLINYEPISKIKEQGYEIKRTLSKEKLMLDNLKKISNEKEREYWLKVHEINKSEKE